MLKTTTLLCLALAALAGCSGEDLVINETPLPDVQISPGSIGGMGRGGEIQFTASVAGYPQATFAWSVSDSGLATVDATGFVRAAPCKVGSFSVKATWIAHPEKSATRPLVVVRQLPLEVAIIRVTDATGKDVNFDRVTGEVRIQVGINDECVPVQRLALFALDGDTERLLTSLPVDADQELPATFVISWDTAEVPDGSYNIAVDALSTANRVRSNAVLLKVSNPQP